MDKKLFRSLLLLITFTVLLIFVIVKFDAIWALLAHVAGIFTPLFIGLAIAFVLSRPCAFFKRQLDRPLAKTKAAKLSVPLAVLGAYLALFAVIFLVISFVIPPLVASVQLFTDSIGGYVATAQVWLNELIARFHLEDVASLNLSSLDQLIKNMITSALSTLSNLASQVFTITNSIISVVVTAALAFVFSIYMLAGRAKLLSQCRRVLKAYLPERAYLLVMDVASLSAGSFTKFVAGQLTEGCIIGFLCFAGMVLLRLDYAPLIGMLVGVSALIPIVGAYVGATLSALLLAMISPVKALTFLVFLVCLQQFEGNVIYPRIVGSSLGLPGIWVLSAVTVGGGLFGFAGMLLSVPVASILYTLLRRDVHKRLGETEAR